MFSADSLNFCKSDACPDSNDLMRYEAGETAAEISRSIRNHLATCEFCAAEVEFYSHYPIMSDEPPEEPGEIPAPLFELAEAILTNQRLDVSSLRVAAKRRS